MTTRLASDIAIGGDGSGGFVGAIDRWLESAADQVAGEIRGLFADDAAVTSGDIQEDRLTKQAQDRRRRANEERRRLELEALSVSASPLAVASERRRGLEQELREKYGKDKGFQGNDLESVVAAGLALEDAKIRRLQAESSTRMRKGEQEAAKERKEREAEAAATFKGFDFEEQALGIQRMRLQGRQKEADYAAVVLGYAERTYAIERDSKLTADEKAVALRRLSELAGIETDLVAMSAPGRGGAASIDAGLGGNRTVAGMVFGTGGGGGNELLTVQKQSRDLLRNINEAVKRQGGATFN